MTRGETLEKAVLTEDLGHTFNRYSTIKIPPWSYLIRYKRLLNWILSDELRSYNSGGHVSRWGKSSEIGYSTLGVFNIWNSNVRESSYSYGTFSSFWTWKKQAY